MKIVNDNFAIGKGWGRIRNNLGGWNDGDVVTFHGIVTVYAQGGDEFEAFTKLEFVWEGRYYQRGFRGKTYSHRGIMIKAKQFAEEIVLNSRRLNGKA